MKTKYLFLALTLTSFLSLFFCEAGASLELRNFEQDGNNYVITVFSSQVCALEFFWKEQEAQQGAYQLIGTLSTPNYGNLYQMKWDITQISDGNYTILIKSSCSAELEQNVEVNKGHWEISPIRLQYPGTTTAKYLGDIKGTVDVTPTGGTLNPFSQYFIFVKEGDLFRITCIEIPESILQQNIYLEMYSHGRHFGTLEYKINDDTLQVRVTFPGFENYTPGSENTGDASSSPESTPEPQNSQEFSQVLEKLNEIQNQYNSLDQKITDLDDKITQETEDLNQRITNLDTQTIATLKDFQNTQEEEKKDTFILIIVITVVISAVAAYIVVTKTNESKSEIARDSNFVQGQPLQPRTLTESSVPTNVVRAARELGIEIETLNQLFRREKAINPYLEDNVVLDLVVKELKEEREKRKQGET